jgi:hypothetical protein
MHPRPVCLCYWKSDDDNNVIMFVRFHQEFIDRYTEINDAFKLKAV